MAGFNGTTSALRPASGGCGVSSRAPGRRRQLWRRIRGRKPPASAGAMQSALDTLDAFPTLLIRDGRPVLENGLHEELAIDHALSARADLIASVFHDLSTHTAVIGRGGPGSPDFCRIIFQRRSPMTAAPRVPEAPGWYIARRSPTT